MIEIKHKETGEVISSGETLLQAIENANGNLSYANLSCADLRSANLSSADLSYANLSYANLSCADLRSANLSSANLRYANLISADLSSAKGLTDPAKYLRENFETTVDGVIVYKRIGNGQTTYPLPDHWRIEEGAYIVEVVNPLPTLDCACGINVATLAWCQKQYTNADMWKCLIEWMDLASVVVPYNTDGKIRCGRVKLLQKIS